MNNKRESLTRLTLLLTILVWTGCRSDTVELGDVSGTVTKAGQPVADAWVEFKPASGRSSFARTDSSGIYELRYSSKFKGALVGGHTVTAGTGGVDIPEEHNTTPKEPFDYEVMISVYPGDNEHNITIP